MTVIVLHIIIADRPSLAQRSGMLADDAVVKHLPVCTQLVLERLIVFDLQTDIDIDLIAVTRLQVLDGTDVLRQLAHIHALFGVILSRIGRMVAEAHLLIAGGDRRLHIFFIRADGMSAAAGVTVVIEQLFHV